MKNVVNTLVAILIAVSFGIFLYVWVMDAMTHETSEMSEIHAIRYINEIYEKITLNLLIDYL